MAWYDDRGFNRRRGSSWDGGSSGSRRDSRSSGRGGWDGPPPRQDGWGRGPSWGGDGHRDFKYDIGEKVIHVATGMELTVIGYGREQLECRKPDLGTVWIYEYELAPAQSTAPDGGQDAKA